VGNIVYIATSIDGYIADRNNKLDWLQMIPNPENSDLGFNEFLAGVDALLMGRNTYESVASMGIEWPYPIPVFIYSSTLKEIPELLKEKVSLISGEPAEVSAKLDKRGFKRIYIDGGKTVRSFLEADLIDQMTITQVPVLLGGGIPLFGLLPGHMKFKLVSVKTLLDQMVSITYRRETV